MGNQLRIGYDQVRVEELGRIFPSFHQLGRRSMRYFERILQSLLDFLQSQDLDGALILGLYFLGLMVFWMLSIPSMGFSWISILMRFISGGFVYLDASNIMAGRGHSRILISDPFSWKPWFWGILVMFPMIWILAQPYYLIKRSQIIRINRIRFVRT